MGGARVFHSSRHREILLYPPRPPLYLSRDIVRQHCQSFVQKLCNVYIAPPRSSHDERRPFGVCQGLSHRTSACHENGVDSGRLACPMSMQDGSGGSQEPLYSDSQEWQCVPIFCPFLRCIPINHVKHCTRLPGEFQRVFWLVPGRSPYNAPK